MWENSCTFFNKEKQYIKKVKKKQIQLLINNLHLEWSNGKIVWNDYIKKDKKLRKQLSMI